MWLTVKLKNGDIEISPINDVYFHFGETCWCKPTIKEISGYKIITHNAWDFMEQYREIPNKPT